MANWVGNNLLVVGKPDRLWEFIEYSKGHNDTYGDQALDTYKYMPNTEQVVMDVEIDTLQIPKSNENPGRVSFKYYTKWIPSEELVLAMSKKYPDLIFKQEYQEIVNDWWGEYIIVNGYVLRDERHPGDIFSDRLA